MSLTPRGHRACGPPTVIGVYSLMVMPMDRAVPAMIFSAASTSLALRSDIFFSAISRSWALLIEPTLSRCGTPEPFCTPAALISRRAAGGVLRMNVNERSSYTLICAGTMSPRWESVSALYRLTNSMMFTPCWPSAGPTGGAGVAWPAGHRSGKVLTSFFFGGMAVFLGLGWWVLSREPRRTVRRGRTVQGTATGLYLGDLVEVELDRGLPAEDRDQYLQLLLVGVDLADRGRQRRERAVGHRHRVTDLEVQYLDLRLGLRLLGGHGRREPFDDLVERERRRPVGPVRGADEAGDARRVAYTRVRLRGQLHPDQDVPGEHLVLDVEPLAVLDLDLFAGRHLDLEDVLLHVQAADPGLQIGLDLVLVPGVRVDDVPVSRREAQRLAQRRDRILVLVGVDGGDRRARQVHRLGRRRSRGLVELDPVIVGTGGLVVLRHAVSSLPYLLLAAEDLQHGPGKPGVQQRHDRRDD